MRAVCKKIIALAALLLAVVLMICGCANTAETLPEMNLSTQIPQKGEEQASFVAQLFFLSDDGLYLSMEEREIQYVGDMSRAEAAVKALIDGPESKVLRHSVPGDMAVQRVETSYEACDVYLLASYTPEAREWLAARAAIAATVFACEDIAAVNLYLNGMTMGYYGRAMGAMQPIANTLDSYMIGIQQEYKEIADSEGTEAGVYENRTATLYFADDNNSLLIAENVTLNYDSTETGEGIAALLINKLMAGSEELSAVLPEDFALYDSVKIEPVQSAGQTEELDPEEGDAPHPDDILPGAIISPVDPGMVRGEPSILTLNIAEPQEKYDPDIMCGALTLTLTGYIPDIQGVAINVVDENGKIVSLSESAYFTREDFTDMIGRIVHIAYPDRDGTVMYSVPRAMASRASYEPRYILGELFAGPAEPGEMYTHLSADDILDVYITGNTVVVDWKAGFEDTLREFIAAEDCEIPADRRERMFIYSVVNTLTELEGVSRVWMLEDGKKLGVIDNIYLGNALMRNPGIMLAE